MFPDTMRPMIDISFEDTIGPAEVIELYSSNEWSSADKPDELLDALRNSHSLVTARKNGKLVGLANAISDGHLVVYYPHLLVRPENQGEGIGHRIMEAMFDRYGSFHQQMLTADIDSVSFYEKIGFRRAGQTVPMWIYEGNDH